jgi:5-methylcytosine-specific restriction endonuclease McrA
VQLHHPLGANQGATVSGEPDPKSRTLARGTRRYRRKIASPKQWQAIIAAKQGPCRVTVAPKQNGGTPSTSQPITFHHLVARSQGGDDVPDNIVPLSQDAHRRVTERDPAALAALAASLTDSERAYVVGKLGEDGLVRLFGTAR